MMQEEVVSRQEGILGNRETIVRNQAKLRRVETISLGVVTPIGTVPNA